MQNFVRNLITEWRKLDLPFAEETFVVAVSGGADSVSLLLALHELKKRRKLNLRIVAAHFNHQLRAGESDADEQFVKNLAARFDFELALGRGEISNKAGNLEQNARRARYRFLFETAENVAAYGVLTGHTLNDQAETFLFNLLRGSGLEGLGGMKPVRCVNIQEITESSEKPEISKLTSQIRLIRPLLNWAKREDTENFCHITEQEFRYDAMNEDLKFNRVRLRKILLPLLKDFNPQIVETLAKTASLLRADAEHLAAAKDHPVKYHPEDDDKNESKITRRADVLPIADLKDVFPSMRQTILRGWLKDNRGNLRGLKLKHIEAVEQLAFSRKSGRTIELPGGEIVSKKGGKLTFSKEKL